MNGHVQQDLLALLLGELTPDRTLEVDRHVRSCAQCCGDLAATAAAVGSLRFAARTLEPGLDLPPLRLAAPTEVASAARPARLGPRRVALAGALAALIAVSLFALVVLRTTSTPAPAVPQVPLVALGDTRASGEAHMVGSGEDQQMVISVDGLPPAAPGSYYEVWLIGDAGTLPVGVLTTDGGQYALPARLATGYSAIDVSVQQDNGNPAHSGVSILRGNLA